MLFWNESSYVENRVQKAGFAVVNLYVTLEVFSLTLGTSVHVAELIAFIRVVEYLVHELNSMINFSSP